MQNILKILALCGAIMFLIYSKREYAKTLDESEFVLNLQETILKENEVDRIYFEDLSKLLPQIKEEFDAYYYIHQGNIIIHQQKIHALNKKDTSKLLLIKRLKVNNELINSMVQNLNQRDKIIDKHTESYQFQSFQSILPIISSVKEKSNDSLELKIAFLDTLAYDEIPIQVFLKGQAIDKPRRCFDKAEIKNAQVSFGGYDKINLLPCITFLEGL